MTALSDDDLFAALTQVKVFTPMLAQALADHISTKAKERDALQARLAEAVAALHEIAHAHDADARRLRLIAADALIRHNSGAADSANAVQKETP